MANRTAKLREYMLHQHTLKFRFVGFSLFQSITKCSNSKKSTIFLSIWLVFHWRFIIPRSGNKKLMRKKKTNVKAPKCMSRFEKIMKSYLLKISTMNWMNLWRFSFPRFLTNSLTKSMEAVLGLYKSSMISAPARKQINHQRNRDHQAIKRDSEDWP